MRREEEKAAKGGGKFEVQHTDAVANALKEFEDMGIEVGRPTHVVNPRVYVRFIQRTRKTFARPCIRAQAVHHTHDASESRSLIT